MLTVACQVTQVSATENAFEFVQGVVVGTQRSVVYMSNSQAKIDAVRLVSGEVIATSTDEARPLLLYDDVLLAAQDRVDTLRVVALTTDLKPKFALDLPLPNRVRNGSFHVGARIDGNEIVVAWRAIWRRLSAIPTHEPANVATGFARIDAGSGRLIAAADGEPPVAPTHGSTIPAAAQKLADDGRLASRLCPTDDLVVALQYVETNGKKQMALRRWNKHTGKSMPVVSLFDNEFTFQNFTKDCRYLLASRELEGWLWRIYSVRTGKRIAEIHNPLPGPEFFVSKSNLIYQSPAAGQTVGGRLRIDPPRLVAIDLDNGKELWARPIGEPTYVGPYPANPAGPSPGLSINGRE
jgi:hypothetical protein